MIVSISKFLNLDNLDEYEFTFNKRDPAVSSIFSVSGGNIKKSFLVTKEYLNKLLSKEVYNVSINTDRENLGIIENFSTVNFIKQKKEKTFKDLIEIANEYELINKQSSKKRKIYILEDILSEEANIVTGDKQLLIEYGNQLDSIKIEKIKESININQKVFYADSENEAMIFLNSSLDTSNKEKILEMLKQLNISHFSIDKAEEGLKTYAEKNPRIVIFGNLAENILAKELIINIGKFDPFVKQIIFENPINNFDEELKKIEVLYYSGYTQIINRKKIELQPLPNEITKKLTAIMNKLKENYTHKGYIETAFTIKKLSNSFNTSFIMQQLDSIKNRQKIYQ